MKNNIKRILAMVLASAMLLLGMPAALAEDAPVATYDQIDYSTTLTVGTPITGQINAEDIYIEMNFIGWTGYAQGYNVALEAGKEYFFQVTVDAPTSTYIDRALAILPETLTLEEAVDVLEYKTIYNDYGETVTVGCTFIPEVSGTYKLLAWGYCGNEDGELTGADTAISVLVDQFPDEPQHTVNINTKEDLLALGETLNDLSNAAWVEVVFGADIDMTGADYTAPAGFVRLSVKGNGHTVTGLKMPLFGEAFHIIASNLTVDADISLVGSSENYYYNIGALIGYAEKAELSNCHATGSISSTDIYEVYSLGGLVGEVDQEIKMSNCTSTVDIKVDGADYIDNIGGLIGGVYSYSTEPYIKNCSWQGKLDILNVGDDISDIGGLIGDVGDDLLIQNCSAKGDITVTFAEDATFDDYEDSIGGLIGYLDDDNIVENCSADVNIDAPQMSDAGGLIGYVDDDNVLVNCTSTGTVKGNWDVGGLIGSVEDDNVLVNCYTDADVTGSEDVGGFVGEADTMNRFENCYTGGTITPTEGVTDMTYFGTFLGGDISATSGTESSEPNFSTFDNCYAAASDDLSAIGYYEGEEDGGIASVDPADSEAVKAMIDALNAVVEENNADSEAVHILLSWKEDASGLVRVTYGDINESGTIDASDALLALQHSVQLITLEDGAFMAANVDGNDSVDASDALLILQYSVKLIDSFPVEK